MTDYPNAAEIPFVRVCRGPDSPDVGRRRRPVHAFGLQVAHRALSLAVWVLTAEIILTIWGRPLPWAVHLLPAACGLSIAAALISLSVLHTSRADAAAFDESRGLTIAAAVLLAGALAWLILSSHA